MWENREDFTMMVSNLFSNYLSRHHKSIGRYEGDVIMIRLNYYCVARVIDGEGVKKITASNRAKSIKMKKKKNNFEQTE